MARLSRRLEVLLGAPWQDIDEPHLERLANQRVPEDFDLEYKAQMYGNSDREKQDLALDVAKLANHLGGMLLLGVEEDEDARATRLPGVDMSDDEELRIRSIVAANVFPHPSIDIRRVPRQGSHGVYMIHVPPSRLAPHAVRRNDSLKYPVRDGTGTRYLTESDVADRYRARFAAADDRRVRLRAVADEGRSAIVVEPPADSASLSDWAYGSWITVSLVPEVAGRAELNRGGLMAFQEWYRGLVADAMPSSALCGTDAWGATVGFRRFEVSDRHDRLAPTRFPQAWHTEFHVDGSGYAAAAVVAQPLQDPNEILINESDVVINVIVLLHALSGFAVDIAGASGDAMVRVELALPSRQVRLRRAGGQSNVMLPVAPPIPPSRHSVSLDDTSHVSRRLLAGARLFLTDLLSGFRVAEVNAISPHDDGLVVRFTSGDPSFRGWAEQRDIASS